jgi:glycerophosphoryl diester phosphodiesterase
MRGRRDSVQPQINYQDGRVESNGAAFRAAGSSECGRSSKIERGPAPCLNATPVDAFLGVPIMWLRDPELRSTRGFALRSDSDDGLLRTQELMLETVLNFLVRIRDLLRQPILAAIIVVVTLSAFEADSQVVVAHGGGAALGPENTLPAISLSFNSGATWVEVDVRLTLDSVAMLMHDPTVDRTTDGVGAIGLLSMAEVKMLDAGSNWGPAFVGTEVPTFEEALGAALGRGPLLVDMKDSVIGSQIAAGLVNVGATASDIVLWTTTTAEVIEAQTFLPGSRIFFQTSIGSEALIQSLASLGVDGVSIEFPVLTPSLVALGHSLGLDVYVWDANGHASIAEALFYGVDGIHHPDPFSVQIFLSEDDCSDNVDNDQDGFLDFPDDPGCDSPTDTSERSAAICDDGIDNDTDGLVDFPFDPGCDSAVDTSENSTVICDDGIDNDTDGFVDFPDDPGCASVLDTSENSTAICDDGIDNDGDGLVDFPDDPACYNPFAGSEQFALVPLLSPPGWILLVFSLVAVSRLSVQSLVGGA